MYAFGIYHSYLNEGPIADFLDKQMQLESKPVIDYCFTSQTISLVMYSAGAAFTENISDINDFHSLTSNTNIYAIPEKFFNVTDPDFF